MIISLQRRIKRRANELIIRNWPKQTLKQSTPVARDELANLASKSACTYSMFPAYSVETQAPGFPGKCWHTHDSRELKTSAHQNSKTRRAQQLYTVSQKNWATFLTAYNFRNID